MIKQAVLIGALTQLRKPRLTKIAAVPYPDIVTEAISQPVIGFKDTLQNISKEISVSGGKSAKALEALERHLKPLWRHIKTSPATLPVISSVIGAILLKELLD